MNRFVALDKSPCHCAALRMAARRVTQLYDTALAASRLTVSQFSLLAEIHRRSAHPPALRELAEAMAMDRSTLGHNLRPLERECLVELRPDVRDSRSRRVSLTNDGRRKFAEARILWQEAQKRFESAYGLTLAEKLQRVLHRVTALDFD